MHYSTSNKLIQNTKNFLTLKKTPFISKAYSSKDTFYGWGRKKSGLEALALSKKYDAKYCLLEDGFIRSIGLGVDNSVSFSIVEDDRGMYYDASTPSKLENILNTYDFDADKHLMKTAKEAISLIQKYHISKYNHAPDIPENFFLKDKKEKVLVILQTQGDSSLEYGLADRYSTKQMIEESMQDNPKASIYIKIHPDVLLGKKKSDIAIEEIPTSCHILDEDFSAISLLKYFKTVYTKTSGMGMEALIMGLSVHCYGLPYYAGWGLTIDKQTCIRRKRTLCLDALFSGAYILYTRYYNPYRHKASNIIDSISTIIKYRDREQSQKGNLYLFGFSWWKQKTIKAFLATSSNKKVFFVSSLGKALSVKLSSTDSIYIWGKKSFEEVEVYSKGNNIDLHRIEDGFVRSVSLGSDLTKGYSIVVDYRGIYFDPHRQSDLEYLLEHTVYSEALIERSRVLQAYLLKYRISKYNSLEDKDLVLDNYHNTQKVLLIVGQVEDDASIIYGAKGMSNLTLLKSVRAKAKEEYLIYKPHPDVLAGNRKGSILLEEALRYADCVLSDISIDAILSVSDEVHTMTSLVGFEALIRGKSVYTYGLPFYAGWGLTIDKEKCQRRKKKLSLDALVATTLIDYPRYLHPKSNRLCEIEVLLEAIQKEKYRYHHDKVYRFFIDFRNGVSRKVQRYFLPTV